MNLLVLLTTVLIPLLLVAGWNDATDARRPQSAGGRYPGAHGSAALAIVRWRTHPKACTPTMALTLAIESMVLMSVIALDVLFYVFFGPC